MIVTVSISEGDSEELRGLRADLIKETVLRGRVALVEGEARPGTLGPVLEGLRILLEPGAAAPFLAVVVAWLRYRTSDLDVTVRRTDTSTTFTMSGRRVRHLDAEALAAEIEKLAARLDEASRSPDEPPPSVGEADAREN